MITRTFKLCLNAGTGSAPYINVSQYDEGETWLFELYSETGERYIPTTGAIVGVKSDGHGIVNTGTVDSEGRVVITETQQMTASAGRAIFELSIDGLTHGTANFIVAVERKPTDDAVMSDSDLSLIQEAVDSAAEIIGLLDGETVDEKLLPIVQSETGDWLTDHITNPSNPPIDTSLTVAGAAADAKATGDEISAITHELYEVTADADMWSQGYWAIADGSVNTNSATWIKTNGFLSENVAEVYDASNLLLYLQAWDKTNGNYVGTWNGSQWSSTYTSGTGLLKLNIVSFRENYPDYNFKITVTKTDSTPINPTTNGTQIFFKISNVAVIKTDISDMQTAITQITTEEVSVNKININSPLTEHYYLWQSGSKVSSGSSEYFISNPIAVKTGDVIRRNVTTASGIQFGAYVNADNTPSSPAPIYDKGEEYTVTRDGYISVNFPAERLQNAMVTINTAMPNEFVPYHEDKTLLSNEIHLNTTQLEDVKAFGSVLNGKKIAYNGDSICESRTGTGTANNGGAYAKLIADYVGGIYENRGLSGGILASAAGDGGSTPSRCVVSDVTNMANDADLICFEGGINDYWRDVPLGTYTESDYTGTLDTTTICGALESIFRQAIAKWVGKPIVFVITHKITSTVYAQNSAGYTWTDVHEKMVGICKKYAIPYYDAFEESGLNAYNSVQNTNFLNSNATGNPDGCHPNEAGYRRYYVPQLIALFESLMPRLEE